MARKGDWQMATMLMALLAISALSAGAAASAGHHASPRKMARSLNSQSAATGTVKFPGPLSNGCVSEWGWVDDYDTTSCATVTCPPNGFGPYKGCGVTGSTGKRWCMLPAYRSNNGKFQGLAWKYTDNDNDPECLRNWTYYSTEGEAIEANIAVTTTAGDTRSWCGMAAYVAKDDEDQWRGLTWNYCRN